jgi:hypothetical protein
MEKNSTVKIVLLALAAAMMFTTCELNGDYNSFDYDLWGTWESSRYSGNTLKITYGTITIHGFLVFSYYNGYPRDVPLEGYSEKVPDDATITGNIFINWRGQWQSAQPYKRFKTGGQGEWLSLYFGNHWEDFKRQD